MTIGTWYWLLLVIALVFGGWQFYAPNPRYVVGSGLLAFILFALLGLKVFGWPVTP